MIIKSLTINNLRVITEAQLTLSPGINLITGSNGAGKTTLLEAIYLLARAKSFRGGNQRGPIQNSKENFKLFANLEDQQKRQHKIGLSKSKSQTEIRINGEKVKRLSKLASLLPLVLITPQSHRIIEEGPEHRRRVLNWGVFHVEHNYQKSISEFSRLLIQRNNALRSEPRELNVWSQAFIESAKKVSVAQRRYFEKLQSEFFSILKEIDFLKEIEVSYYQGWRQDRELSEVMESNLASDRLKGYTSVGPHRSDMQFKIHGVPTRQVLSRGQQKLLVIIVFLAQARLLASSTGEQPIFLFDDLESELDRSSIGIIQHLLEKESFQLFITTLSQSPHLMQDWYSESKVFHVEHGQFS